MKSQTDLKSLQKQWYQKLKDEGFNDIEKEINGRLVLKQRATHALDVVSEKQRTAKELFYERFKRLAYWTNFPNEVDRIIMINYSEGMKIVDIVKELKNNNIIRHRQTIRYIIRRWQMKWGLKNWNLKQMNLKGFI